MARPREFDEDAALAAAIDCFWTRGYEATSVRDLADSMGITGASLYNAFGDKRALFRRALQHYSEHGTVRRYIAQADGQPPRRAIMGLFQAIIAESLADPRRRGCLVVNTALEIAPHDPECRQAVTDRLDRIESFFRDRVAAGQADGTIAPPLAPDILARHLLALVLGIRVMARLRPEPAVLDAMAAPVIALLDGTAAGHAGAASE
ncbi:TetR/AcrR family transcriptional regulator [Nguyenibacter sp. L1]|uniref:TetR/AcrR family transcriptional regulator n=1 Tax=Nguyenibacter sp. L1 TaxID=3049350 RepID=UPI002B460026|nr:TetR/AcrR family transcriptional regulator [Nguyenibacter sp. L1]WRH87080.1 TetR/AcrR family transcriptional regulator [Nguyenibacter sp. L1]